MIKTALFPFQSALYDRLKNDSSLAAVITDVYDNVPPNATMPYLLIGDDTSNDDSNKTQYGEELTITIHIWSEYEGTKESKQLMDLALQSVTSAPLVLDGFDCYFMRREMLEVLHEEDAGAYHGIMRLRFKTKQL